ncbi:MAG: NYN domain-containing protein [Bdellovibrionaceae bacterium]|nr:NYN domain-containing protein [Pseudobdellovibrionaceae bacterium]
MSSKPFKTIVYIDGLNLYYSLKNTPYKWLNLKRLITSLLDSSWHKIIAIKYFTARVQSPLTDPKKDSRQDIYLRAIQTLQNLNIIYGKFKKRDIKAIIPVKNHEQLKEIKKITEKNIFQLSKYEEKETDVNIATHIMYDCCKENISSVALLSNDTDLKLPLWFARKKFKKRVIVITPPKNIKGSLTVKTAQLNLQKISNKNISITSNHLKNSQFPDRVNGILKPKYWK